MVNKIPSDGMWPRASELLLLQALVSPGRATSPIWQQLRELYPSAADILATHPRLAPLLHYRINEADLDWPDMAALAEAARRVWGANQMRVFTAIEAHTALESAGIRSLFLKGLAVLHLYPAESTRPMHDIDILVQQSDFDEAVTALVKTGWSVQFRDTDATRRFGHAGLLSNKRGEELDLHWRLAPGAFEDAAAANPWGSSRTIPLAGRSVGVLEPTYQLYHTMSHGLSWAKDPSLQWIPDAAFIIESGQEVIDWERLLALADANQRGAAIRDGLRLLSEGLDIPIPERTQLSVTANRGPEAREAWFLRHIGPRSLLGGVPDRWYLYRRIASSAGESPTLLGFWRYLRWRWAPHGSFASTIKAKIADRISANRGVSR